MMARLAIFLWTFFLVSQGASSASTCTQMDMTKCLGDASSQTDPAKMCEILPEAERCFKDLIERCDLDVIKYALKQALASMQPAKQMCASMGAGGGETQSAGSSIYEPLANHLLARTKSRLIPITEKGKKVHVVVQVGVQSIERIDRERNQVELSLWTAQQWMSGLTWDPKGFNGLNRFLMPVSMMWTPGIRMGNVVRPPKSITPQHVVLLSHGVAVLNEHNRVTLACDLSDDACLVYFSSPVYDNDLLALETPDKSRVDLTGYFGMWANKGARYQAGAVQVTKLNVSMKAYPDTYDVLSFSFGIRDTQAHYRKGPSQVIFKWH